VVPGWQAGCLRSGGLFLNGIGIFPSKQATFTFDFTTNQRLSGCPLVCFASVPVGGQKF
jgi:hypothetical protein